MENRGYGPMDWYAGAGLAVAGITLVGWRVYRRFATRGLVIFLMGFSVFGLTRDFVASQTIASHLLVFANGVTPLIADFAAWFTLMSAAFSVQMAPQDYNLGH